MAAKKKSAKKSEQTSLAEDVADYRHDEKRKNNPPAGLVEFDRPPAKAKKEYAYDPHLDPQLVWAGKAEHTSFEVDTVSLHIHERISTQAILRAVRREEQEPQMNLFAKPELPSSKEVDFYSHEVGWANRMILGDSLTVMNSLLERENMAGQVQCIYMDPPYGVKFNSNFQPAISRREVKDGDDASLTREPEQIQAFRDTWELGVHSYLGYLRDRLLLARSLLSDSGSVFVQISDDNVHHVREVMDEVFGAGNIISTIAFVKTSAQTSNFIPGVADFILWYARDRERAKYRPIFGRKEPGGQYSWLEQRDGRRRRLSKEELAGDLPEGSRVFRPDNFTSARQGREYGSSGVFPVRYDGVDYRPGGRQSWKTNEEGSSRLVKAERLMGIGATLCYVRYLEDFPVTAINNVWTDTGSSGFGDQRVYVVQTTTHAVQRCVLMTTDPSDLVVDPTCGSGTTALVAEQWGRRWITCDTSRVALSLARQRLLTAKYPYYELRSKRVKDGFKYKTVPHITLKSIAQNPKIDACKSREEIEKVVRESADQETLYDQPFEDKKRIRVTGPFTVEAIPLASMEDPQRDVGGSVSRAAARPGHFSEPVSDYVGYMVDLLRQTGVLFRNNKRLRLPTLRTVKGDFEWFHAEGTSDAEGDPRKFAVSFGPRHGPVSTTQVLGAIKEARNYDVIVFAGFACDPEARKMIDQPMHNTELVFAHASPDILVGDLLKKRKTDQLFTVFGAPDVAVHTENGGSMVSVELRGVDLYDPTTGSTEVVKGDEAAAIFVDHDYDGKSFCVSQALFPGGGANAWEKLQKALKGSIDEEKFAQLRTTRSLPFKPGARVAVKVIDDRGTEVIKVVDARKHVKK
jgi:adenine-specific DNA-methyltransferase